jgi:hypothetical protein
MPHGKSPITSPIIPDKTPIPSGAAVQSIDELLWALIELLVENGAVNSAELSAKVESLLALGIRRDGPNWQPMMRRTGSVSLSLWSASEMH